MSTTIRYRIKRETVLYVFFLLFLLSLQACDFAADTQDVIPHKSKIHLTILFGNGGNANYSGSTRSDSFLKNGSSINTDATFYEDRVRELMIYVFDSSTGELAPGGYKYIPDLQLNQSVSNIIELPEGTFDFYFIANMPAVALKNKMEAENYMKELRELPEPLFSGPKGDAVEQPLFPMSRVYRNQVLKITSSMGTSVRNPIYFRPINEKGLAEDYVFLNRVVAKIEVSITGFIETSDIHRIALVYGVLEYSLASLPDNKGKNDIPSPGFVKPSGYPNYLFYVPEVVQTDPDGLIWNDARPFDDGIPVILIEMDIGEDYFIPIASNYTKEKGNYLDFVSGKGTEMPEFNLLRNHHYFFTVNVLAPLQVEVNMEITPFFQVPIEAESYPGIVNVDKRTLIVDANKKGTIYFNFVSHEVDASDYMQFVGASETNDISTLYPESVARVTPVAGKKGFFRLDLDFSNGAKIFYLHFRNRKSTTDAAITLPIIVEYT